MRYCTECGQMLNQGDKFCRYCGHPIEQSVPVESSPAEQAESAPAPEPETTPKPKLEVIDKLKSEVVSKLKSEVIDKLKSEVVSKLKHVANPNLIKASGTPGEMTLTSWTTGGGGALAGAAGDIAGKARDLLSSLLLKAKAAWPGLAEKIHFPKDRKKQIIVAIVTVLLLVLLIIII